MGDLLWRHLQELPAFRALLRATEARLYAELPLPEPVLDLGCGDGHFGAAALPRPPHAGLDPSEGSLREARRRGAYGLLVRAEGGKVPFEDRSFSTVISNSVLEHIAAVEPVLLEVARVLRPGGVFCFSVPGPGFLPFLSIGRALDRLGLRSLGDAYRAFFNRISGHHHNDGPEVWQVRLEAAGLRLVRCWPYFSRRALSALEWGHYLGLPSLVAKVLTRRWILWPSRTNLWLTERIVRPLFEEPWPREGAYLFFVAEKPSVSPMVRRA